MKLPRWSSWIFMAIWGGVVWQLGGWGALAFVSVVCSGYSLLAGPARLQRVLIQIMAHVESRPTQLSEWPQLDHAAWEENGRAWRELGFQALQLEVWNEDRPALGVKIAQMWRSAESDAVVEISQAFLPTLLFPVESAVFSFWGDGEAMKRAAKALQPNHKPLASPWPETAPNTARAKGDRLPVYAHVTDSQTLEWAEILLFHPQLLGIHLERAMPAALWFTHLERCELISRALKQSPLRTDLDEVAKAHGRVIRAIWRGQLKRGFLLRYWRAKRCGAVPMESWGELEAQICALEK